MFKLCKRRERNEKEKETFPTSTIIITFLNDRNVDLKN